LSQKNRDHEIDQDDAERTDAAVTEAVYLTVEPATEATEHEDDEDNDTCGSELHASPLSESG
jgi:hypothetical protein